MHTRLVKVGFTLVELLVCLAVFSVLVGTAAPALRGLLQRAQATTVVNWLVSSIVYTRHSAILLGVTVTLCPSATGTRCEGEWHQGMIAFTDSNQDHQINGTDRLLKHFFPPATDMTINWRSFRRRNYLQMIPQGLTNYQNGNFVYCPASRDLRFARQLVINMPGRVRHSRDSNGDGFVEDRSGKHLSC